jgi:hypothetical protein
VRNNDRPNDDVEIVRDNTTTGLTWEEAIDLRDQLTFLIGQRPGPQGGKA